MRHLCRLSRYAPGFARVCRGRNVRPMRRPRGDIIGYVAREDVGQNRRKEPRDVPVTPFHGGVGLLTKGWLGRRFSFISFCATQVVIDCESGYYLLRDEWPFHRFLHTLLGAAVACTVVALVFRFAGTALDPQVSIPSSLRACIRADLAAAATGQALILTIVGGVLAHLIPDAIMHSDVRLFAPLSDANPLYGLVPLAALHWSLILAGVVGTVLVVRNIRRTGEA